MGGLIHVGAWRGLEYVGSDRELILFEPQADAFAYLAANFDGCANVTVVRLALAAQGGQGVMFTAQPNHSSSLLPPCATDGAITFAGEETVTISTLDTEMRGRPGFTELHVDTQGYELEVLKGGVETLAGIERVELEVHRPSTYPGAAQIEALDEFLIPLGFTRTRFDVDGSDDLGDATYERNP